MEQCRGINMVGKVSSHGTKVKKADRCGCPGLASTRICLVCRNSFAKTVTSLLIIPTVLGGRRIIGLRGIISYFL